MKAEVGQYIRNKRGFIGKVKEVNTYEFGTEYDIERPILLVDYLAESELRTVKDNPIDLIDCLDLVYVNIDPNDGWGGIVVPRIAETEAELKKITDKLKSGEWKLVYIVTQELQMSCRYVADEMRNM